MAQEFYRRAQILHEEFQKRELQYLNAEKKWNNMIWKKDINMPLQEYLQKLDKREMETEETYKSLMKQMEELDKHTDMMSLKLDRLGVLQSNITNIGTSNWLSTLTDSNSQSLEAANRLQTSTNLSFSAQRQFFKSASTQTENKIYCEKCSSEILTTGTIMPFTAPNFQSSVNVPSEIIHSSKFLNSVTLSNEMQNVSQLISSPVASEQPFILSNANKVTYGYQNTEQTNSESLKCVSSGAVIEKLSSVEHNLQNTRLLEHDVSSDILIEHNTEVNHNLLQNIRTLSKQDINYGAPMEHNLVTEHSLSQNTELLKHDIKSGVLTENQSSVREHGLLPNTLPMTNPQIIENNNTNLSRSVNVAEVDNVVSNSMRNNETEKPDIVDNDACISKSDEGSINHEFDFLESDTANTRKSSESHVGLKMAGSRATSARFNQTHSSVEPKSEEQVAVANKIHRLDDIVDKNDTSGSATGPQTPSIHSANLSLASDSDSIGEKETPLKASAAYQALLGNTTILETRKKQYSDSESEDEIENVLANAVRKNSKILPKPNQEAKNAQPKKNEKPGIPRAESKPANKPPKSSSASKPQSKLSKSTRKVLGLETSSGSEVEIAAKTSEKKIEEDSDEFDFFD